MSEKWFLAGLVLWITLFFSFIATAQDSDVFLSEIYISAKGDFILRYPSDWRVVESQDSGVSLRRAFDETVTIAFTEDSPLNADAALDDMLNALLDGVALDASPPLEFVLNRYMAARTEITFRFDPLNVGDMMSITINDLNFRVWVNSPVETRDEFLGQVFQVLETIETPRRQPAGSIARSDNAALPWRFTNESGDLSFDFPEGWHVYDQVSGGYEDIYVYSMSPSAGFVRYRITYRLNPDISLVDYIGVGSLNSMFAEFDVSGFELDGRPAVRSETHDPLLNFLDGVELGVDLGRAYVTIEAAAAALADPETEPLMVTILESVRVEAGRSTGVKREPTPWEERIARVELPQRFVSADGALSFSYPRAWRARETDEGPILITQQDYYSVGIIPAMGASVRHVLREYLRGGGVTVALENNTQFLIGDRLVGYAVLDNDRDDRQMLLLADVGDALVYVNAPFAQEDAGLEETLLAVLLSAEVDLGPMTGTLTPSGDPALPQTYTSARAELAFNLPDGWQVVERPQENGFIALLQPPASESGVDGITIDYLTGELRNIQELAMIDYDDVLHDDLETSNFVSAGNKGIRVDMSNEDYIYLRNLNLAIDLEGGNILITRMTGSDLLQFDWEPLILSIFESARVLDGTSVETTPAATAATCTVSAPSNVNLRGGPGTQFAIAGTLVGGTSAQASGQAAGADGFVWWQLTSGYWVRSDVVSENGDCETLPATS